jgi:hypothetical protein
MAYSGGYLYIVGGLLSDGTFNHDLYSLNLENNILEKSMFQYPRLDSLLIAYGNNLYLLGGLDQDNQNLLNIFIYNIETQQWDASDVTLPLLINLTGSLAGSTLFFSGKTDIGFTEYYSLNLETFEILLLAIQTFSHYFDQLGCHQMLALDANHLFIIGGTVSSENFLNVPILIREGELFIPSISGLNPIKRTGHRIAVSNNLVLIYGGENESFPIVYDILNSCYQIPSADQIRSFQYKVSFSACTCSDKDIFVYGGKAESDKPVKCLTKISLSLDLSQTGILPFISLRQIKPDKDLRNAITTAHRSTLNKSSGPPLLFP